MTNKLKISSNPHVRNNANTFKVMVDFIISLLPAIIVGVVVYGKEFSKMLIFAVVTGLIIDKIFSYILKIKEKSFTSATIITVLLLILSMPIGVPLWVIFLGVIFSIVIGKLIFGGLGQNIFNPALLGRIFLMISFPQYMYNYHGIDNQAGATMLQLLKYSDISKTYKLMDFLKNSFVEINKYNSVGEASLIALLVGFLYLIFRKRIDYKIPLVMFLVVVGGGYLVGKNGIMYALSGGIVFGAIYFLTDPVSSPYSFKAKVAYATLVGLMIIYIRENTSHPEGVAYAIFFGNIVTPLLDKLFIPRVFGRGNNMREVVKIAKVIFLTFCILIAIYFVNIAVQNKIENQTEKKLVKEMKKIIPKGEYFDFHENSKIVAGFLFIPVYNGEKQNIGYIVQGKSKGYSKNEIEFLLGIDLEGKTLGHIILSSKETLGLGSQIESPEYKDLWVGKDINTQFKKGIDSPSGATYTFLNFFKTIKNVLTIYDEQILPTRNVDKYVEPKDSEGGASKTEYKKEEERKEEIVDVKKVEAITEKAIEEVKVKDENVKKVEKKNTNKKVEVKKEVVKESPKTTNNETEEKSEVDGEAGASQWN
ncbi:MAG: RnfABCDGE type electron transport complex subunit D [Fusobacteriaceae bacterium]|nr:RnfABCDGE type electron transport complex subunit D [Fusobacteriaceae bacterium]MBN2838723.1 RnfABCDGE type electron transport complex subunit D [Fusobacteriaceae bacterium]